MKLPAFDNLLKLSLNIDLRLDGTAFFYMRHPDSSEGLRYQLRRDTLRLLRNNATDEQYKLVAQTATILKLRHLKTGRILQLTRRQ